MTIRQLRETELDELMQLYAYYTVAESLPALSPARMRGIWREVERNPGVHYLVMEEEGRLAAACIFSMTPSFIRGGNGYGVIEHVVTHGDFRRRGLAKALMEYVLELAWKEGCTEVMLLSGADLKPAHQLYENLGFDKERRTGFIIFRPGHDKS